MTYAHLTEECRCQIYALRLEGKTQDSIATHLGVAASTISREIKRNSGGKGYRYKQANQKAMERRHNASSSSKKMTPQMVALVEDKLLEQWSPVQISGVLAANDIMVSHETIYKHVRNDKKNGGKLYMNLRRRGKKYNHKSVKTAGRGCIPGRVDIKDRPKSIESKERLGDWEGDTIIGAKQQGVILSHVDRKSKFTLLDKMDGKHAEQVPELVAKSLERLPVKIKGGSITYDNGKEFSKHQLITELTGLPCFFARPYRSCDRGLNEHTNGLVRQYFPKGTNLNDCSIEEIRIVENKLNNRPRKVLNFRTPREVLTGVKKPQKIALQS